MEHTRHQEAARQQQAQVHVYGARQAAPNQQSVDDFTAWMGELGYGQSTPHPAQLQAATEFRQMQRSLHDAKQALAAERALRAQQAHQQPQHLPPLPQQPQYPPAPPPSQHAGPS